jgi:hypothetical protein
MQIAYRAEEVVAEELHVRADPREQGRQRQAVDAAERMVSHDHERPRAGHSRQVHVRDD